MGEVAPMWGWNRCGCFVLSPSTQRTTSWQKVKQRIQPFLQAGAWLLGHFLSTLKPAPDSRSLVVSFSISCPSPPPGLHRLTVTRNRCRKHEHGTNTFFLNREKWILKEIGQSSQGHIASERRRKIPAGRLWRVLLSAHISVLATPPMLPRSLLHSVQTAGQQHWHFLGTC